MSECIEPELCLAAGRHIHGDLYRLCKSDARYLQQLVPGYGTALATGPCLHLGAFTGERRRCETCRGATSLKLRACSLHGTCTEQKQIPGLACCVGCPDRKPVAIRQVLLRNRLSPGDCLVMTAAIECLHEQHPGRFRTAVDCPAPSVFEHNPHIVPAGDGFERIEMAYPLIHRSNQEPVSFLQGYVECLADKLKVPLRLTRNRPALYFSDTERSWVGRVEEMTGKRQPYWIVNAGTKNDMTCKQWPLEHYQQVIDSLRDRMLLVQVGAAEHNHRPLRGVLNQIGKTNLRELLRLALHAEGGIGPSTFLQHVFAALEKPYICLLGGREPLSWVNYPLQTTLHTMGALDCCRTGACWTSRVVALPDNDGGNKRLCKHPVETDPPVPECMRRIGPGEAVAVIERYMGESA